jgi:hypothetical protein
MSRYASRAGVPCAEYGVSALNTGKTLRQESHLESLRRPGDEKNGALFKRVYKNGRMYPYSAEFSQLIRLAAIKSQVHFICS